MHSDLVAKKFLTELNGFDFLLDRLFSKKDTTHKTDNNLEDETNNEDLLSD